MRASWIVGVVGASLMALGGASCVVTSTGTQLRGSGTVITEEIPVGAFSELDVSSTFQVHLSMGSIPALSIQVDDNVEPYLDVGVANSVLRIGLEGVTSMSDVTLEANVTATALTAIRVSGASVIHAMDPISGTSLTLDVSGASGLDADVGLESMGATMSGASRLDLQGQVGTLVLDASGACALALRDLSVEDLDVTLSGASSATVSVSGTLAEDLSGASSLTYVGSPTITTQEITGASSVHPIP